MAKGNGRKRSGNTPTGVMRTAGLELPVESTADSYKSKASITLPAADIATWELWFPRDYDKPSGNQRSTAQHA